MSLGLNEPWFMLLGIFVFLPWLTSGNKAIPYSSLARLPEDPISACLDRGSRLLCTLSMLALALAMTGPHRRDAWVERVGFGARIVLLVDHSSSMNENFSGAYLGGRASESKSAMASRLLTEFVQRRRDDLFALVAFSASPISVLPLTQDREALLAAIHALSARGHGVTHIAPGLAMALNYFRGQPANGSRVVLLVSDGAARMDEETRDSIREMFLDQQATLYWIYLRNPKGSHLDVPPNNPNESTTPEYFLHQYFQTLGVSYHAYEAENREAMQRAIADLERLENQPLIYRERLPREDLSDWCYGLALACGLLLLVLRGTEIKAWRV